MKNKLLISTLAACVTLAGCNILAWPLYVFAPNPPIEARPEPLLNPGLT